METYIYKQNNSLEILPNDTGLAVLNLSLKIDINTDDKKHTDL